MKHTIGSRLKELRGGLSQAEMAARLGTRQSTYSAWERGGREPDIKTVLSVDALFNVTADWLLGAPSPRPFPSSELTPCPGCSERDSRIDKLLDILNSFKGASPPS